MTSPDDKEQEYTLQPGKLETEINYEPPLYKTRKHYPLETPSGIRKIIKFAKFVVFMIFGIAIIKVGLIIGVWLTYLLIASIVGYVGYKLFLDNEKPKNN